MLHNYKLISLSFIEVLIHSSFTVLQFFRFLMASSSLLSIQERTENLQFADAMTFCDIFHT